MAGGSLGGGWGDRGAMITDINVTPLVDIMLVLLIIFMVTATYIVRDSLDVKLPEASTGQAKTVSILAITIATDGSLSLNGQRSDESKIRKFISEKLASKKDVEAVIGADKSARHGMVVKIIDLVRQEGVKKFAINVIKPEA
jgi:biopolymer transport protein TolR